MFGQILQNLGPSVAGGDVPILVRVGMIVVECIPLLRTEGRTSRADDSRPPLEASGLKLISATATRLRPVEGIDLVPSDPAAWRSLRSGLGRRQEVRVMGHRFRRHPMAYLLLLKKLLIKRALPSKFF